MSRFEALLATHCSNGVKFQPLSAVGTFIRGNGLQKSDLTSSGHPAIHYGQVHTVYGTSAEKTVSFVSQAFAQKLRKAEPGDLVIATTSEDDEAVAKAVAWVGNEPAAVSGDAYIFRHNLDPKYVAYFFQTASFQAQKSRGITGTKVKRISGDSLGKVLIPVPPIEVQREIVRILDTFSKLEAELEAELEARRLQYAFYRKELLKMLDGTLSRWITLGEIGKVLMCKRVFKHETSVSGEIPFYKIGTFGGKPDAFITKALFEDYKSRFSYPRPGEILISAAGTIGRAIPFDGEPSYFQDSNIVWLENDETVVLNRFLYYWYQIMDWTTDGGTIQRLYNERIRQAKILVPSIRDQERVITILDALASITGDLTIGLPAELNARRQQYEHYRDRLLTFQEAK